MKKILFIFSSLAIISCNKLKDETPKCDDSDVLQSVKEIIVQNQTDATDIPNITNIRQTSISDENKSCGCEANVVFTRELSKWKNTQISYTAQKNAEGNVYVEVFK